MTELSGPRLNLHLDSFYSKIIDEQQGKNSQNTRF